MQNGWYLHPKPGTKAVIVFVHGINSTSENCWRHKSGTYWPDVVKADSRFSRAAIFLGGYYTDIDSKNYRIADCADELYASLSRTDNEGCNPLRDFSNVVFVCHSLGGLVVRYLLES